MPMWRRTAATRKNAAFLIYNSYALNRHLSDFRKYHFIIL